jgi:hypothetical protein
MDKDAGDFLLIMTDPQDESAALELKTGLSKEATDKISFVVPVVLTPGQDIWTLSGIMKLWMNNINTRTPSQLAFPAMNLLTPDLHDLIANAWRLVISA